MAHRDHAGDPPGRRGAAGGAGHLQGSPTPPAVRPRDRRRLPQACGRPNACGRGPWLAMPEHRRATRSWPKTLGRRLYGSLLRIIGMRQYRRADPGTKLLRPGNRDPFGGWPGLLDRDRWDRRFFLSRHAGGQLVDDRAPFARAARQDRKRDRGQHETTSQDRSTKTKNFECNQKITITN